MILHHDFSIPRLAQIHQLVWRDAGVEVTFQYGICNISGTVISATDFIITLQRDGAVGIRMYDGQPADPKPALLQFLAGEIVRETRRWTEDVTLWAEGDTALPAERAAILNIVSALVAYPSENSKLLVVKDIKDRARVSKLRIYSDNAVMDVTSSGVHGANLHVQPLSKQSAVVRSYRKYDIPVAHRWNRPAHARFLTRMSYSTARLALLPMDFVIYLFQQAQPPQTAGDAYATYVPPAKLIDANGGDSLSALYSA